MKRLPIKWSRTQVVALESAACPIRDTLLDVDEAENERQRGFGMVGGAQPGRASVISDVAR